MLTEYGIEMGTGNQNFGWLGLNKPNENLSPKKIRIIGDPFFIRQEHNQTVHKISSMKEARNQQGYYRCDTS